MYQPGRPCTRLITYNFVSIGTGVLSPYGNLSMWITVSWKPATWPSSSHPWPASSSGSGRNDVRLPVRLEPVFVGQCRQIRRGSSVVVRASRALDRGVASDMGAITPASTGVVDKHDVLKRFCGSGPGRSACSRSSTACSRRWAEVTFGGWECACPMNPAVACLIALAGACSRDQARKAGHERVDCARRTRRADWLVGVRGPGARGRWGHR